LRIDVARALSEYGDTKARGALHERLGVDLDPRVRRRIREALRDLGGDSKKALDAVREELDKVTGEAHELRARIVQLETRMGLEKKSSEKPSKQGDSKKSGKKAKKKK
jgi:aminopeptidase N